MTTTYDITRVYTVAAIILTFGCITQCYSFSCDDVCSQGIVTIDNSCDCDASIPEIENGGELSIDKRNSDYMYNKIFKWGKRRFVNPASDGDRLRPIDNINRRIFRWGKRSGYNNERPENIFRWGKRAEFLPEAEDQNLAYDMDQDFNMDSSLQFDRDNQLVSKLPFNEKLTNLRKALQEVLIAHQGQQSYVSKRQIDRDRAMQGKIFTWGKRSGKGNSMKRQTERENLRKIFMWG